MSNDNGLDGFAERLNDLCTTAGMPLRGRPDLLGKKFGVSREAARKWLQGKSWPTLAKRAEICAWANVSDLWLMTGSGDKHPVKASMTVHQRQAMEVMQNLSPDKQALAVRLLVQLADDQDRSSALTTGSGISTGYVLHEPKKAPH